MLCLTCCRQIGLAIDVSKTPPAQPKPFSFRASPATTKPNPLFPQFPTATPSLAPKLDPELAPKLASTTTTTTTTTTVTPPETQSSTTTQISSSPKSSTSTAPTTPSDDKPYVSTSFSLATIFSSLNAHTCELLF